MYAKIAQLVERHLAKVEVAGSNPVFRSNVYCSDGEIGRHAGLKIQWAVMPVRVQVPLRVQKEIDSKLCLEFFFGCNQSNLMGAFVISKKLNGDFKFIFASRKGKTIFTSIGTKHKSDCELMIAEIKQNTTAFAFTKVRNTGGKFFFRLSKDGLVLANSRKFTTELLLQKGIDEIVKYVAESETLDFSEPSLAFPDADTIFLDQE